MRYLHVNDGETGRLLADDGDRIHDLTSADGYLDSFRRLTRTARAAKEPLDAVARRHFEDANEASRPDGAELSVPIEPDEVWAAGVTYEISEEAREAESGMPEIYLDVYEADRPEIFFKGTRRHLVGPDDSVGVRGDSDWNVPEPELGVVLHDGDVVGYTIGNDVSSRSIEGANPLYLPQAKVYDRACSIGPAVVSARAVDDPHDLEMSMRISRNDETVYEESTNTGEMVRTCEELVNAYTRHQAVPQIAVLLTGTSLVPSDEFTLRPGDEIDIEIESIGVLRNGVTLV